jgi:hypothetical protein
VDFGGGTVRRLKDCVGPSVLLVLWVLQVSAGVHQVLGVQLVRCTCRTSTPRHTRFRLSLSSVATLNAVFAAGTPA